MRIGLCLWLVLCAAVSPALAQNLTPQQRQALLDYKLTLPGAEHLIAAMQEMTKYLVSLARLSGAYAKVCDDECRGSDRST
jgi:hypothetical protein